MTVYHRFRPFLAVPTLSDPQSLRLISLMRRNLNKNGDVNTDRSAGIMEKKTDRLASSRAIRSSVFPVIHIGALPNRRREYQLITEGKQIKSEKNGRSLSVGNRKRILEQYVKNMETVGIEPTSCKVSTQRLRAYPPSFHLSSQPESGETLLTAEFPERFAAVTETDDRNYLPLITP